MSQQAAMVLGAVSLAMMVGCSTKNYVRTQTAPLVQKTNELDDSVAANNRNIKSTDERAQSGIKTAQAAADTATTNASAATQAATKAQGSAQEAVNRADSLSTLVANLDNYKPVGDISVTFAFDKSVLTKKDKEELDAFGPQLTAAKSYILEVTGGTDSVGDANYNYQLSQRRAEAVVQYLAEKFNVPAHKFYLIGIGKDQEVATNKTAAGRAQNRRVKVQILSNASAPAATTPGQ
jgi:outer membrane protein OmpA-like peptidoglycan-associated protein